MPISNNKNRTNKQIILWSLVGALIVILIVSGIDYTLTQIKLSKIPESLRINTDKDNIIGAQVIPQGKIYDKEDPTKVIYEGEVVKYAYKTEKIQDKPNEVISKRTKHSRTIKVAEDNEKITYQLEVISGVPQYYEDEEGDWYQADYGTTDINTYALETKGTFLAQLFKTEKVYATTGTFYPDANPETSTVDGYLQYGGGATWSEARDSASSNYSNDSGTDLLVSGSKNGATYAVIRTVLLFYTNLQGMSISDAVLSVYGNSKTDNQSASINVVSSSPASNTGIGLGDFSQVGSTSYASKTISSISTTAYNDFTLDVSGKSIISNNLVSKFALRHSLDLSNTESTASSIVYFSSSEVADISQDPKLVVTYTVPVNPKQDVIWFE